MNIQNKTYACYTFAGMEHRLPLGRGDILNALGEKIVQRIVESN